MTQNEKFYMGGTQGTGEYLVYLITAIARLGVRTFNPPCGHEGCPKAYRIRVEPVDGADVADVSEVLTPKRGWKQPGDEGQLRWSKVIPNEPQSLLMLQANITQVLEAIQADAESDWNPDAPEWARPAEPEEQSSITTSDLDGLKKTELIAIARERGLKVSKGARKADIVALIAAA
jgi:hypothetical protein